MQIWRKQLKVDGESRSNWMAASVAAYGDQFRSADGQFDEHEYETYESCTPDVLLSVRPSTIEAAGDGLFLASHCCDAGTKLLSEEGRVIKRPEAKKLLNDPGWKHANPVIQLNKNQFLDIRALRMYKANHATVLSGRNNIEIMRTGAGRIEVVALRNIYEDEELFWEYAPTWQPHSEE